MKKIIHAVLAFSLFLLLSDGVHAQLTLPAGTSYTQNFDSIGSGLPTGWSVRTGATASSLGTEATFTNLPTQWSDSAGRFKNFASSEGLVSSDTAITQSNSTDRILGVRQTSAFGDPGAAFVLQLADTAGRSSFEMSLKHQMVSAQGRTNIWSVQYSVDSGASWTTLGTYTTADTFGSTDGLYDFGAALDNQPGNVYIRVACLTASTGSGNRDSYGLDDFVLSWTEGAGDPNPPSVTIITTNQTVLFTNETFSVSGTANTNTVGELVWTNALASAGGTIAASESWQIDDIPLAVGANVISVTGTNAAGTEDSASVTITRLPEGNQPPLISLSPTSTTYNVDFGAVINITVNGAQPAGDPGQETIISATDVPAGATFAGVTGAAPVSAVFNWPTDQAGTATVSFVVSDVDGAVTQAVTIVVGEPPPEGSTFINFEGAGETKTVYASTNVTLSGLIWDLTDTLIGTDAADWKNGNRSARFRGYATSSMTLLQDITNGLGNISFQYRRYGTATQVDWKVEYSVDGGLNWTQIGTTFTAPASDDVQTFSEDVNVSGNVRVRILRGTDDAGVVNRQLNVDNILLLPYEGGPVTPTVQFAVESDSASEDAGEYVVTITKSAASGDVTGDITVGGTAPGADFSLTTTNISLLGATTSQVVRITIVDNAADDGDRTVILGLANLVNADPGAITNFTLTIQDDDEAVVPELPVDLPIGSVTMVGGNVQVSVNAVTGLYYYLVYPNVALSAISVDPIDVNQWGVASSDGPNASGVITLEDSGASVPERNYGVLIRTEDLFPEP